MSTRIIFETHSTSEDSEAGIATGWLPGRLSATGRQQAAALGERRRADSPAVVYSSDLARAIETAEIAFGGSGIPTYHDKRLRECNYGELNGSPAEVVAAARVRHIDERFPGGESYNNVVSRMIRFLHDVVEFWDGRTVLLIGHSATYYALEKLLNSRPLVQLVSEPVVWEPGWEYEVPWGRGQGWWINQGRRAEDRSA